MRYYPVYLDIKGKKCVVVGGGDVAERKVERLLQYEAAVSVVGKDLTPQLIQLKKEGMICHIAEDYRSDHINGALLVIGATDDDRVNAEVSRDSRERNIPVNIVDDPVKCDFIVPSIVQSGDLSIAVSTGGKSPALARNIREELEEIYGTEYAILLDIMGQIRERVIARGEPSEENKRIFDSVLDSEILKHIRDRNWGDVKKIIHELVNEDMDLEMIVDSESSRVP
jgi:precorrin-2 dehydrogenase/sirohydrochlorin ferrochelatase